MANFNEIEFGREDQYTVAGKTKLENDRGYLVSVKNSSGKLEFSRLFFTIEEGEDLEENQELTLIPWSMNIIPIKRPNANGELRTYRTISGLAFNKAEAQAAAMRNMQNFYDSAEQIADSPKARALARRDMLFSNFVDRADFIKALAEEGAE